MGDHPQQRKGDDNDQRQSNDRNQSRRMRLQSVPLRAVRVQYPGRAIVSLRAVPVRRCLPLQRLTAKGVRGESRARRSVPF